MNTQALPITEDNPDEIGIYIPSKSLSETDESLLHWYWTELTDSGHIHPSFPEHDVTNAQGFMDIFRDAFNVAIVVLAYDPELDCPVPVGHMLLHQFQGLSALAHFSATPRLKGRSVHVGKEASRQVFMLTRDGDAGVPLVKTMVGLTPLSNRLALRFTKQVGFKELHVLEGAYRNPDGTFEDARLAILREEYL